MAVADTGGVSGAARRLGLPKSIVSRRLARLESELSAQLLTRTTRGAALTEAARRFASTRRAWSRSWKRRATALLAEGELRGLLRIAAPLSFGATHLAPVIAEFACRHPQLHDHDGVQRSVRGSSSRKGSMWRFARLATGLDAGGAAHRAGDGAARRDARIHRRRTARRKLSKTSRIIRRSCKARKSGACAMASRVVTLHPQGRFKADNGQALVAAVLAGLGIAMLPDFLIDEHIASGALVTLLAGVPDARSGSVRSCHVPGMRSIASSVPSASASAPTIIRMTSTTSTTASVVLPACSSLMLRVAMSA